MQQHSLIFIFFDQHYGQALGCRNSHFLPHH